MAIGNIVDVLSKAAFDALQGYGQYQHVIKPALEEQQYLRAQRAAAEAARLRDDARTQLADAHAIYGTPQSAFAKMGEDYLELRRKAGLIVPKTREEPETSPVRTTRAVYPTRGPFEDVTDPTPLAIPAPRASVMMPPATRSLSDQLRGRMTPAPAVAPQAATPPMVVPMPGLTEVQQGGQPIAQGAPVEQAPPEIQTTTTQQPTGRTRRVLDLPAGEEEMTIDTPAGAIPLSRLKQVPEAILKQWFPDPIARAQLAFDVRNAMVGRTIQLAGQSLQRYQHDNPSGSALLNARLQAIQQAATQAYQGARLALERQQMQSLDAFRRAQLEIQREGLAIRRQALAVRGQRARTGALSPAEMIRYYGELGDSIRDMGKLLDPSIGGLEKDDPDREVLQAEMRALVREREDIRKLIQGRAGLPGRPEPGTVPSGLSRKRTIAEERAGLLPPRGQESAPSGARAATATPPAPVGARGAQKTYQTATAGTITSSQVQIIIRGMVRKGMQRDQIRRALEENGIPPKSFGY